MKALDSTDSIEMKLRDTKKKLLPVEQFYSVLAQGWAQRLEKSTEQMKELKRLNQTNEVMRELHERALVETEEAQNLKLHYQDNLSQIDLYLLKISKLKDKQKISDKKDLTKSGLRALDSSDANDVQRLLYTMEALLEIKGA